MQGKESPLFLSYFKKDGIEYLPGGVKSGFHHVDRNVHKTRLLRVKGKRVARIQEVTLSSSSLTTSDVFILDAGAKIYLYIGETSNMYEKAKGVEVAASLRLQNSIRDETDPSIITSQSEVVHIHEDPQNPAFWALLGGETSASPHMSLVFIWLRDISIHIYCADSLLFSRRTLYLLLTPST